MLTRPNINTRIALSHDRALHSPRALRAGCGECPKRDFGDIGCRACAGVAGHRARQARTDVHSTRSAITRSA
jgi:hypothetical protein